MPVPFKVKAVYDYKSDESDDLSFPTGQIITVTEEDDADWYTGEYTDNDGQKLEGIFPRNFVEKYEPVIPSRPAKASKKSLPPEPAPEERPPPQGTASVIGTDSTRVGVEEAPTTFKEPIHAEESVSEAGPPTRAQTASNASTALSPGVQAASQPAAPKPATKQAPPVADKPSSNSFRDRIAAFNKPAAAPITPFKPAGAGSNNTFIKKPFVAPPPSRNAYVPPPTQPPAQKSYRREEDPSLAAEDDEPAATANPAYDNEAGLDDQPKPTSLKDRIALLQQQQLEQAQRSAEKKKAPKKPAPKRIDSHDGEEQTQHDVVPLKRRDTGDTLGKRSIDLPREAGGVPPDRDPADTDLPTSTTIPSPSRELVSDTNDADDSGAADTDAQEVSTEEERTRPATTPLVASGPARPKPAAAPPDAPEEADHEEIGHEEDEGDEDDEDDEDPEERRRRELRERMAKMSGGMGMMGMLGGGMPMPGKKPKAAKDSDSRSTEPVSQEEPVRAPPVPIMALPGLSQRPPPTQSEPESEEAEDSASETPMEHSRPAGDASDDYLGAQSRQSSEYQPALSPEQRAAPPPPPPATGLPQRPGERRTPAPPPPSTRPGVPEPEPTATSAPDVPARTSLDRQGSARKSSVPAVPPPPPTRRSLDTYEEEDDHQVRAEAANTQPRSDAIPPAIARPPPPPPPKQPPSRTTTVGSLGEKHEVADESEDEVTEYDGDYDTDIASSAKHKEALKAHNRGSSLDDEGALTDDAAQQPVSPPLRAAPPPPPPSAPADAPRELPPPPPPPTLSKARRSGDMPRTLPPPVPQAQPGHEDYDPYMHSAPKFGIPSPPLQAPTSPPIPPAAQVLDDDDDAEDMYSSSKTPVGFAHPPPPPPPAEKSVPPLDASRPSLDVSRTSTARRSTDQSRAATDFGMAGDLDLGQPSGWWTQENSPPPSIAARGDVFYEIESNASTKRGGKTTVTRDVYVLFADYSQTTINATFDPADPQNVALSQTHGRPPPAPRQDQLEAASELFGSAISKASASASGSTVGDGTASAFVLELLRPHQAQALMPVGTRSYGAPVYANLANASTQQHDAIRAGDIITFRNAKFSGHKGGLHTKYSMEAGKPDHVGVVIDWDGTKKKIRAWEQGREEKGKKSKVREESYRIGDLKSGEVRVWRVMPRNWVGWDK